MMTMRMLMTTLMVTMTLVFAAATGQAAGVPVDTLLAGGWAGPSDSTQVTILLVRHAEKNTTMVGHDVPLSIEGAARAQELMRIAGEAGVSAIYATPTTRSRDTAYPIARSIGDSLTVINEVDETVRHLKTDHWGRTVMVVGHSDTVPQIIAALTGRKIPGFSGFDLLYVVTLSRDGRSSITRLRYGAG